MSHVDLRRLFPIRRPGPPGARWLLGLGLLLMLCAFFWGSGTFTAEPGPTNGSFGAALFFSAILAYIVPIFGYISERTGTALDELRDNIDASPTELRRWRERVDRKPRRWLVVTLVLGIAGGVAHNLMIYGSAAELWQRGFGSTSALAVVAGTMLTWLVVTLVVAGLLDNAMILAQAGRQCRVNLLDTHALRPFATVAVSSTLALVGAQAVFPVMGVDDGVNPVAYIPGLLATGVPMLLLAALPIYPVHRRIARSRRHALAAVNASIDSLPPPNPGAPETLTALAPLLTYRRELDSVSEWPFDIGMLTRLALYLIIPPLTWVGAALIEHVVNALL